MNLTSEELIKLVEAYDSKTMEFEKNIVRYTGLERSDLKEYQTGAILVLVALMKLKQVTIDEMIEECLKNLPK